MNTTLENPLCSFDNTVKSRITRVGLWMIVVIGVVIPVVFLKSGLSFRPYTFEFIQRWLSPPYIYLVLNLVILSIFASPRLLHYLLWAFNYFKKIKKGYNEATTTRVDNVSRTSPPPSSVVAATTTSTTSSDNHFYQDWHDFIHDQAPTSLSLPLEGETFDEPWPDIVHRVESPIETPNYFDVREIMEEKNLIKKVKRRGDNVCALTLPSNETKKTSQVNKHNSLKSMPNATKGREKLVSPLNFIGNNLSADDTLEGTWKTIMRGGDITISNPSLIRKKKIEEIDSPLSLIGIDKNNFTSKFNEVETMDATWKAIMEGGDDESPPSKLSTSESERISFPSKLTSSRVPRQDALAAMRELRKSETFNETVSARERAGLRRDPSLSLDDLNCRVESFIKNFNHQQMLQRQESEQRFSEMINSGGY